MSSLRFQVDAFLVRDLDSRINAREAAAVSEFITNSRNKASARSESIRRVWMGKFRKSNKKTIPFSLPSVCSRDARPPGPRGIHHGGDVGRKAGQRGGQEEVPRRFHGHVSSKRIPLSLSQLPHLGISCPLLLGSGELRVWVARRMGSDSADALRVAVVQKVRYSSVLFHATQQVYVGKSK